ncbi:MAG TPA: hypothetical protein VMV47_07265 [Bacteroidales bacterium]|nr:hypothetical protein [Bacteroidales bacterium]
MIKKALGISCVLFFVLFFISDCTKKDEIPERTILSGTIIDQVTKQPIEGASVYLGNLPANPTPNDEFILPVLISTTDQNGHFSGYVFTSSITYVAVINRLNPFIYAAKSGYIGSDYSAVSWLNAGHSFDLSLYHPAKLIIYVWNDTISNNIDEAFFGIAESSTDFKYYPGFIGRKNGDTPLITKYCSGRKFNQNFEFYPLWGNLNYTIYFNPVNPDDAKVVTVQPDTAKYFSISF